MADDIRLPGWSLRAPAGMTIVLQFVGTDPLTSLSVFTGGTVEDLDVLTGATEHAGVISGDTDEIATVNLDVPAGTRDTPLRLVIDGAVQTVGVLIPSNAGTATPAGTIELAQALTSYTLTVLGVLAGTTLDGGTF